MIKTERERALEDLKKCWKKAPVFMTKFIAELESGNYNKGKSGLLIQKENEHGNLSNAYCCLGVACKMYQVADKHLINKTYIFSMRISRKLIMPKVFRDARYLQQQLAVINDRSNSFIPVVAYLKQGQEN